jgi:hypothetical protein
VRKPRSARASSGWRPSSRACRWAWAWWRVFERFHRVEAARGRTHEGSGIGLALVQEIVKLHGGTVELDSVWGQGSCFTVRLPLGRAHLSANHVGSARALASTATRPEAFVEEALRWLPASTAQDVTANDLFQRLPEEAPVAQVAPHPRARVLLAEDNADMRSYVTRLLAPGFEVEAVANGQAALEAARQRLLRITVIANGVHGSC